MATEFKKLSEVTLLDEATESATVLVEDGGDIKRVPKNAVGSAGGYVIHLSDSFINDDGYFQIDDSYDELYDVLQAGGSVWVDTTDMPGSDASPMLAEAEATGLNAATNIGPFHFPINGWLMTDVGMDILFNHVAYGETIDIYYPNGSHNLEPIEEDPK